jgi:hypothetical protein
MNKILITLALCLVFVSADIKTCVILKCGREVRACTGDA